MIGWLGKLSARPYVSKSIVFIVVFVCVWGTVQVLPSTSVFWTVLNGRFAQDERYQLQRLFLPDQRQEIPLVIVGDALFLDALPDSARRFVGAQEIVVNNYDPDDLRVVIRGLRVGERFTETRACTLLVQVSPLFSLRAKTTGVPQDYRLVRDAYSKTVPAKRITQFFGFLDSWAQTTPSMPAARGDPGRPDRMVGQARFSDSTRENWDLAFADVSRFDGPIIAVLDTRGTNWGADSDLIEETRNRLDALAAEYPHFSWVPLEDVSVPEGTGCAT